MVNLGAQVSVPQLVERAVEEKADAVLVSQVVTQRDAHLLNTREMSAAFREAFPPARRPLLVVGGPRFDETMAADLGVDRGLHPGHDARRGGQLPRAPARHREGGRMSQSTAEVGLTVDPPPLRAVRRGALRRQPRRRRLGLGLFGDVATEMCIRTDGDEGLFASYSDVQFRAPVHAGDVVEATATLTRVGTPLPRDGLRAAGRGPRRRVASAARRARILGTSPSWPRPRRDRRGARN